MSMETISRVDAGMTPRQIDQQMRSLISATAEGIYGIDLDGNCTFANEACARLLGYESTDELLGQHIHLLIHHSHGDGTAYAEEECKIYKAYREAAQIHVDDEVFWRKDGSSFDVEYWSYPQLHDGRVVGCVVTFLDVTERRILLRNLIEREAHLRRVIDNIMGFVGVLDTNGVLREANAAALEAGGVSREDVVGKPFWECYWWSHDEQVVHELKAAIAKAVKGEVIRYDVEVRMVNDSRLMIDFMIVPVKDSDGKITHLIPSGVDISERKWAETAVQQRIAQLDLALEAGRMGIWEWDIPVDRVTWSARMFEMFGYAEENFVPTKAGFLKVVHPDDRSDLERMIDAAFTGSCENHEVEFRVIRGDNGEVVWTHCRGKIHRNHDGRPLSILSVAVDITVRKERELALAFLADVQSRLAALASPAAIVAEASQRAADYMQLSHFLAIKTDKNAEKIEVFFDHCRDGSGNLVGTYNLSELATFEERQSLVAGSPVIVNDASSQSRPIPSADNFAALGVGSILFAPSSRDQRLKFMVCAIKRHSHAWREDEIDLLRQLSNIVRLKLERAEAESALRDSEERFRDLADNISQLTWMADASGSIFWYNQRWFDYTGTTFDEMKDWGWKAVQHPEHLDRVVSSWKHSLETGEVWEDTFPLRSKDNDYRWFLSRARPIHGADGKIQRWFGSNTDITDAKKAAEELKESQEQLRLGIEVADFALAHIDYTTNTVSLSPEAARLYGLGDATMSVSRKQLHDTFHAEDRERVDHSINASLGTDQHGEMALEHRIVLPGGDVRWLNVRKRIFFDRSVNPPVPINGILAARDITEHKHWEIELADRESHLRRVINNQLGLVGVIDRHGVLVEVDDRSMSIAGLTRDDVIGKHFADCAWWTYDPEVSEKIRQSMKKAFSGETVRFDVGLYAKGNQRLMIDFMIAPVRDDDGQVEFLIPSGVDISERKTAEEQLRLARAAAEASNQSKSEFLANMSHEIRTPMTAILGYTDLIAEKLKDVETLNYIRTIRQNGDFLLDIINDILDLSKIEAGKFEISQQPFSLKRIVEDVRSIMDVRAKTNQIDLIVEYQGTLPELIESDPKRLRQILINLVGNAIKFTPAGSVQVIVSYCAKSNQLRFDVRDSGIGISDKQKSRLFLPFSQGDGNVNREFGGTGLGLAISKRLTEMLGGEIWVESDLGKGSTFSVTISAGDLERIAAQNLTAPASSGPVTTDPNAIRLNCHILVVDDRRDIRFLSRRFLTDAGATIEEAEDGEAALAIVTKASEQGNSFDLIILDMQMPKLDGYATAKVLRQLGFQQPIIALTADAMQGNVERCINSGCNAYLSKPIDRASLLDMTYRLTTNR
jgi:PAS domain S-box-containing protein